MRCDYPIEIPGHADTPIDTHLTFDGYVESLLSILPVDTHLIGYSMGGRIALKMALRKPDHFSAITIESADPSSVGTEDETATKLQTLPYREFIEFWYNQPLFTGIDVAQMTQRTQVHDPKQLIMSLQCFSKERMGNLWPHISPIAHKLTYISGSLDLKYGAIGKKLQVLYPQVQHKVISHMSHNTHWNAKDPYAHYGVNC